MFFKVDSYATWSRGAVVLLVSPAITAAEPRRKLAMPTIMRRPWL